MKDYSGSIFRLIGVKPNKNCNAKYRKILKNQAYFFYDGYEIVDGRVRKIKDHDTWVPVDFYKNSSHDVDISISAIIGKNGDGKSSIVELIMRILNNFAYVKGFTEKQNSLKPVKYLQAELYYEIDDKLYTIISDRETITWKVPDCADIILNINDSAEENKKRIDGIDLGEHFFYTQISNYSLYAYNSRELSGESDDGHWIDGVFHKNDGYQTPIVLTPMRTEGNIDVNTENDLAQQRLISLLITDASFRTINKKQTAQAFQIKLFEKSKLEQITLLDFFKYYGEEWRVDYFIAPSKKLRNIDEYIHELQIGQKKIPEFGGAAQDLTPEFNNYTGLLDALFAITQIVDRELFVKYLKLSAKLYKKVSALHNTIGMYIGNLEYFLYKGMIPSMSLIDEIEQKIRRVNDFFKSDPISIYELDYDEEETTTEHFNFAFLQRIITVAICEQIWRNKINEITSNHHIAEKIIDYIVYKTISIISRYPNYKDLSIRIFTAIDFTCDTINIKSLEDNLREAIDEIWKDITITRSHISLKLRQCINFLNHHPYGDEEYIKDKTYFIKINDFDNIMDRIGDFKNNPYDYFFPPIFEIDTLLQHANSNNFKSKTKNLFTDYKPDKDNGLTLLSQLSSGERQQINTVSSILYHLKNINSVVSNVPGWVKYQHVNLIFEEIELYFHPEFQRTFLNFLLQHLSRTKLGLKSVNLCFITHSPFILSDIPKQNILLLNKGENAEKTFNTLGANIHEMLGHNFMLEYTIGEVVRHKIKTFIDAYNRYKKEPESYQLPEDNNFEFLIENMGDGYLKKVLQGYYTEIIQHVDNGLEQLILQKQHELDELKNRQCMKAKKTKI